MNNTQLLILCEGCIVYFIVLMVAIAEFKENKDVQANQNR